MVKIYVHLETNHGLYRLEGRPDDDIKSVLDRFSIPMSSVWTFVLEDHTDVAKAASARRVTFVPATTRLSTVAAQGREIHARVTRNINLPGLLGLDAQFVREIERPSTEWTFPSGEDGAFKRVQTQMSAEECFDFVVRSVDDVLSKWPAEGPVELVLGTSGGGDSNVLLSALMQAERIREGGRVVPTMMLGIPDWDTQVDNARQICTSLGLELQIIEGERAAELAGVSSLEDLKTDFHETYPDADLEFLGTWLLRKVLGGHAHSQGMKFVATGANREDIIAEGLSRIARGLAPLPSPYRPIGDVTFAYPMYKVPKKIGDGAYPTFSLENYEARNPSYSPGRSVFYYLSYYLADLAPGFDVDLLNGLSTLADLVPQPFEFDSELQDHVVKGSYTPEQHRSWQDFLARHRSKSGAAQ
ncbi:hypothetical protein HUT11_23990 [Streptomyces seoulensis]|nr:hypothetical protein HUT11_23990 [Streptomyces seoulensis]